MAVERKYERDIDLLLAEEFSVSPAFARWFLGKTRFGGTTAEVEDVFVSQSDTDGESDLVVLFRRDDGNRFALFIEDKIDAPFMPEQRARYTLRAERRKASGEFDDFEVILCAPTAYREGSTGAKLFESCVSYQDIGEALALLDPTPRGLYRAKFLTTAAQRSVNRWQHVDDPATNLFWEEAYKIANREFPILEMKEPKYSKGSAWIWFRPHDFPSIPRQVRIELKGQQGHVDLTFPKTEGIPFATAVAGRLPPDMLAVKAGSSAAIRLRFEGFRISDGVATGLPRIRSAFEAGQRLIEYYRANRDFLDSAAEQTTLATAP